MNRRSDLRPQSEFRPLGASDFPAFVEDCEYIGGEIQKLDAIVVAGIGSFPE
jgi:hypothetical protein